jgi:hypothetical protein
MKTHRCFLVALLLLSVIFSGFIPKNVTAEGTRIEGSPILTSKQMGDFVLLNNSEPKLMGVNIYRLAELFLAIGSMEGIRGDIAFSQAILETGYFSFGNDVLPEQNNFAGIGATGGGAKGAFFLTPEEGVRAQIQHLKAYANKAPLVTEKIDPRFDLVKRGVAPFWTDLNNRWAVPGHDYGEKILTIFEKMKKVQLAIPNVDTSKTYDLPIASLYLKSERPLIGPTGQLANTLKGGFSYRVYGTLGDHYNLGGNYRVSADASKMSVYIGRVNIPHAGVVLYKPDGSKHRTLKIGENIRVYSYDNQAYYVGGGYFIKRNDKVSFYKGVIKISEDTPLYNSTGEVTKILKNKQEYRVYQIDQDRLHVGGGYYLQYDRKKQSYNNI